MRQTFCIFAKTNSMNVVKRISESIELKSRIMDDEDMIIKIEKSASQCVSALTSGCKLYFCGNGGSAADAQHLSAELSGRYYKDRAPLPAEALHVNTSYLTAVANDYGYDEIYSRMLSGMGKSGDVLIAISTSGNSRNIVKAIEVAHSKGMFVIGMTGRDGGAMRELCDILLNVPSDDTPRIQESHIMIGHIICEIIETEIFGDGKS